MRATDIKALAAGLLAATVLAASACTGDGYTGDRGRAGTSPATRPAAVNTGAASRDGALDPCVLVTAADAERALGAPVEEPQRAADDVNAVCMYRAQKGSPPSTLSFQLTEAASEAHAIAALGDAKAGLAGLAPEDLSGIGDEAFWLDRMKQLHARKGTVWFTLVGDAPRAVLVELARTVVARLP